jgi:excisionase family DNA binding protein
MHDTLDDTLTPEEVAQKLKISPYTVRRLLKERKLRGIKIAGGRYWRIRRRDFEDYLNNQEYPPTQLSPGMETAILSEPALRKEWLTPEEDDYWAHL